MYATVVEFDTLTDTVRAAAEDHDFVTVRWVGFALFFISGVHISGVGSKLCRTGIYHLISSYNAIVITQLFDFFFLFAGKSGNHIVRELDAFCLPE